MELERITTAVRPRLPWEAVDLGFVMARRWWWPLAAAWLLCALPVFVIAHLIFTDTPAWAALVFWWLKPLYEQAPLYVVSRRLFGEEPSLRQVLARLPRVVARQLLFNLLWRRLAPARSFNAPVAQLEGLRGKARRQRLAILHRTGGTAGWLTFVCAHLEGAFYLGLLVMAMWVVPEAWGLGPWLIADGGLAAQYLGNGFYFLAVFAVAPFYVAGGFSLYLNRRVELEAWDLELAFRSLARRLEQRGRGSMVAAALLAGILVVAAVPSPGWAAEPGHAAPVSQESARRIIDEVMQDEVFGGTETRSVWRYTGEDEEGADHEEAEGSLAWLGALANHLSMVGELFLWTGAAVLLVIVALRLKAWSRLVGAGQPHAPPPDKPQVLFGMDVAPDSLPPDVAAEARRLLERGDSRGALGLLYRASLVILLDRYDAPVSSSATEGECLALAQRHMAGTAAGVFEAVTRLWQGTAYGHRLPHREAVQRLLGEWTDAFAAEVRQ